MKFINSGITLMEVMVSMVLFSALLGMTSQLVNTGLQTPFIFDRAEPWINFIEENNRELNRLTPQSPLFLGRLHQNPFPAIVPPPDLKSWSMRWVDNNLPNLKTALFHAESQNGQKFQWRNYWYHPG